MKYFFIALLVIASIIILITTLMMEPKTKAGSSFGQTDSNMFGTSVHKTKDAFLNKITIVAAVVFTVSLVAMLAI